MEKECVRPSSSYGSIKTDSDVLEEEGNERETAEPRPPQLPVVLPVLTVHEGTGYCILV